MAGEAGVTRAKVWRALGVLAFFVILTAVHTWPLASGLSTQISSSPDVPVSVWSLNDLAGQILHDPRHLFEGRIFYPYAHTLTFVDHQITNALLATPLVASGLDPIVVYNLVLLLTFFLSGAFCYLLVHGLTRSVAAGLVAGSLFAFSTYRFHHHEHLHLLGTQWLPMALWAMHRFLARPSWPRALALGVSAWLVALASWQLAVIGAFGLGLAAIATILADGRPPLRRVAVLVAIAALVGLSLAPLGVMYANTAANWGGPDGETTGTRVDLSVRPVSFVTVPAGFRTPYASLFQGSEPPLPAFPGIVAVALALFAVWTLVGRMPATLRGWIPPALFAVGSVPVTIALIAAGQGQRGQWVVDALRPIGPVVILSVALAVAGVRLARRLRDGDDALKVTLTYTVVAVAGGLLALGPFVLVGDTHLGRGVYWPDRLPPLSLLRAPERFTMLFTLGISVLAGIGLNTLLRHRRGIATGVMSAVAVVAVVGLNADIRQAPLAFGVAPTGGSEVHQWLANAPEPGAVLEYPWNNHWSVYDNRAHGRRIVNGRAYVWPRRLRVLQELPALSSRHLTQLWEHFHPRFVVLRAGLYPPDVRADVMRAVHARPDALRLRARFRQDYVYELIDRGADTHLYRIWPRAELERRRGFAMAGRVTGTRAGTIPRLVARLNGYTMLDRWGAEATRPYPRVLWLDPKKIAPGLNTMEIFAGYRFGDDEPAHTIGTSGGRLAADVVVTAGRDRALVEVNGQLERATRGYLLAVLNPDTGEIIDLGSFDTSAYREESDRLARFIDDIPTGSPVLVTSQFDVSRQLTEPAVQALRTLGLREDLRGRFNWIHAAIGVKGAPPGSVPEGIDRQVSRLTLGTPAHPRVELSRLSLH